MRLIFLCFAILGGLWPAIAHAEPPLPSPCAKVKDRPCTALVLGGGGARGGAHIGIIKQLEAQHIPVDLIVGTSFGSFVGALYASGKSPAEIETLLLDTDWNEGYRDRVSRDEMPMRRKHQADAFNISLGLGVGLDGAKLPAGVLQGQALAALLQQALGTLPALENFDQLPIPYRAVAADLVSGDAVALDRGNLASAIQASMSIPGVVQPMELNGQLLVDGGIAAQVPVKVARDLGAQRIIAVEISSPGYGPDQLSSAVEVMDQLSYFLIRKNVQENLALLTADDVLLIPPLGDISTFDFDRLAEAIASGEQSASTQQEQLARLAVDDQAYRRWQYARQTPPPPPGNIDRIVIDNRSLLDDGLIRERLGVKEGDRYDQDEINKGIRHIYGLGTFERVTQEVHTVNGQQELRVLAREKRWGPGYLDFQLQLENDFDTQQSHEIGASYTLTNISRWGGEWRNELVFGSNRHLGSEIYWPLATSPFYLQGQLAFDTTLYSLRDSEGRSIGDMTVDDLHLLAAFGWSLTDYHDLSIGIIDHQGSFHPPSTIDLGFDDRTPDFSRFGLAFKWEYDTLDSASLPTRGQRWQAVFERSRDKIEETADNVNTVELNWLGATRLGDHHIIRSNLRWQDYLNNEATLSPVLYQLGGFLNLSGYPSNQLFGRHLRYANLVYSYQVAANDFGAFRAPLYLGTSLEAGNVWDERDSIDLGEVIWAGSLFMGWDSPLGPLYIAYGKAEGQWDSVYFYLGDTF